MTREERLQEDAAGMAKHIRDCMRDFSKILEEIDESTDIYDVPAIIPPANLYMRKIVNTWISLLEVSHEIEKDDIAKNKKHYFLIEGLYPDGWITYYERGIFAVKNHAIEMMNRIAKQDDSGAISFRVVRVKYAEIVAINKDRHEGLTD